MPYKAPLCLYCSLPLIEDSGAMQLSWEDAGISIESDKEYYETRRPVVMQCPNCGRSHMVTVNIEAYDIFKKAMGGSNAIQGP